VPCQTLGEGERECLDHVFMFGEADLRRVLRTFAGYYNKVSAPKTSSGVTGQSA
jgi:hypothetical protein